MKPVVPYYCPSLGRHIQLEDWRDVAVFRRYHESGVDGLLMLVDAHSMWRGIIERASFVDESDKREIHNRRPGSASLGRQSVSMKANIVARPSISLGAL